VCKFPKKAPQQKATCINFC